MEQRAASNYVQISNTIFVPKEWPVRGMETFLLGLAEIGISEMPSIASGGVIVMQVCNIPTKLVSRKGNYGTQYFFERIESTNLPNAYVVDIIFSNTDKNLVAELNPTGSGDLSLADNTHYSYKEISIDNYVILLYQAEDRTEYYMVPIENAFKVLPWGRQPKFGDRIDQHSERPAKRSTICCHILLFIAGFGISSLYCLMSYFMN